VSAERRSDRQANDEPSLGMSIGLLCAVLFAMFAIVGDASIPDVQFVQIDFFGGHGERAGRPLRDHLAGWSTASWGS
jgi:hypothetical protein